MRKAGQKEILLLTNNGQCRTSFKNIQFVEAYDRGTRFFLTDETMETKVKFSEVENMLPKSMFLTCHRACIVNLALTNINNVKFSLRQSGADLSALTATLLYAKLNAKSNHDYQ